MCSELELPLIVETVKKPFLGGCQILALYEHHLVIATTRIKSEFPINIYYPDGATSWLTVPRTRAVQILSLEDIDQINSYESGFVEDSKFSLTITTGNKKVSIELQPEYAGVVLTFFSEYYSNKFIPHAKTMRETVRSRNTCLVIICLAVDIYVAWSLWEIYTTQTVTGHTFVADAIRLIYEKRGFPTTAALAISTAALFNFTVLALCFTKLKVNRTLNCVECGYNLLGQTGNTCPECGSDVNTNKLP